MTDFISNGTHKSMSFLEYLQSGLIECLPALTSIASADRVRLLIAISGGPDSTALLLGLQELARKTPITLRACHINHGVRGRSADSDEHFCRKLCDRLHIPLSVEKLDFTKTKNQDTHLSEEVLRERRYAALERAAIAAGDIYILTAHVLDDQIETILFNFLRGTSPRGLVGMRSRRQLDSGLFLLRPLLRTPKVLCSQYLSALGVTAQHDQSNEDLRFARNFLRHAILPKLLERFPGFPSHWSNLSSLFVEEEDFWSGLVSDAISDLCKSSNNANIWSRPKFGSFHPALQRRVLAQSLRQRQIEVSFARIAAISAIISDNDCVDANRPEAPRKVLNLNKIWSISATEAVIIWTEISDIVARPLEAVIVRVPGSNMLLARGKILMVEEVNNEGDSQFMRPWPKSNGYEILVDLSRVKWPLILRTRKVGDLITPLGMDVRVRLKKFLQTHKRETGQAENVVDLAILADQEEVLWVPGIGMSEKLRIAERPSHRLRWLTIEPDSMTLA
jgi:tRNA(Ile)-lysidine synthase